MMDWLRNLWNKHSAVLVGVGVGLLAGILMLTINFWRTLLLLLLCSAGALCGYFIGKHGAAQAFMLFLGLFKGKKS